MSANNVDLSAMLPVLTKALKPFDAARTMLNQMPLSARPSPATTLRSYAPVGGLAMAQLIELMEAIDAVYRMAGAERK